MDCTSKLPPSSAVKISMSTNWPETRMSPGIMATSRLLARSNLLKIIVAMALCVGLFHWCLDVKQIKEQALGVSGSSQLNAVLTLKFVSPEHPWNYDDTAVGEDENVSSQMLQQTSRDIRVPEDVISDGRRANESIKNLCPLVPPNLVGSIPPKTDVTSLELVESEFPDVSEGGHFKPKECRSRHKVAILIPYRDRAAHLPVFVYNLHRVLSRQQIDYGVFVIEQGDKLDFNRAKLLNVGFMESTALYDYQCFVFHDVDLVPVDDRNVYTCPENPRHMSVTRNDTSMVFYPLFFGGVSALNKEHMLRVNGYSNVYWGWGAEDDDMAYRLVSAGLKIQRRPGDIARYFALGHKKSEPSEKRVQLLNKWRRRVKKDGLNSLKYRRLDIAFKKLYTWILVDLNEDKWSSRVAW